MYLLGLSFIYYFSLPIEEVYIKLYSKLYSFLVGSQTVQGDGSISRQPASFKIHEKDRILVQSKYKWEKNGQYQIPTNRFHDKCFNTCTCSFAGPYM